MSSTFTRRGRFEAPDGSVFEFDTSTPIEAFAHFVEDLASRKEATAEAEQMYWLGTEHEHIQTPGYSRQPIEISENVFAVPLRCEKCGQELLRFSRYDERGDLIAFSDWWSA